MTEEIYEKFDAYNWDGDETFKVFIIRFEIELTKFQSGVKKMLDLKHIPSDSSEAEPLTAKYRVFYFSKYVTNARSSQ
jgi:hypothetical protein